MIAPLKLASNCRSFIIEVPARTDNCVGSGLAQGSLQKKMRGDNTEK